MKKHYRNYPDYHFREHMKLFVAVVMVAGFAFFLVAIWNLVKSDQPVKINMHEKHSTK